MKSCERATRLKLTKTVTSNKLKWFVWLVRKVLTKTQKNDESWKENERVREKRKSLREQ